MPGQVGGFYGPEAEAAQLQSAPAAQVDAVVIKGRLQDVHVPRRSQLFSFPVTGPSTSILTHTTDALIQLTSTRVHSTDAFILYGYPLLPLKGVTRRAEPQRRGRLFSFPVTGPVTPTLTHTTDALILATFTRVHTTDALIYLTSSRIHTTDAIIVWPYPLLPLRGVPRQPYVAPRPRIRQTLPSTFTRVHTTDAFIQLSVLKTHTTDALVQLTSIRVHSTDAIVVWPYPLLPLRGVPRQPYVAPRPRVRQTLPIPSSLTHATDALIQLTSARTHTTDAFIRATFTRVHTTDAFIRLSVLKTHTTDALVQLTSTRTHTTDAIIIWPYPLLPVKGIFQVPRFVPRPKLRQNLSVTVSSTRTHSTDALIKATLAPFHTTDAVIRKTFSAVHTTNAVVTDAYKVQTHTTNAYVFDAFAPWLPDDGPQWPNTSGTDWPADSDADNQWPSDDGVQWPNTTSGGW